jgi:hypothetical protein
MKILWMEFQGIYAHIWWDEIKNKDTQYLASRWRVDYRDKLFNTKLTKGIITDSLTIQKTVIKLEYMNQNSWIAEEVLIKYNQSQLPISNLSYPSSVLFHWACWCSSNPINFCFRGTQFKFWSGYRLTWDILSFFYISQSKCWNSTFIYIMATSFQIFAHSLVTTTFPSHLMLHNLCQWNRITKQRRNR